MFAIDVLVIKHVGVAIWSFNLILKMKNTQIVKKLRKVLRENSNLNFAVTVFLILSLLVLHH